jgi:transcription termination factor NusB
MDDFKLSKRHIKESQDPARMTAESLFKIIKFIFYRVPEKQKSRFLSRLRGKIIRIHPGELGVKKLPPSSAIGQAIAIAKNLLSGLNPAFTNRVIVELSKLLTTTQKEKRPIPKEMERPK